MTAAMEIGFHKNQRVIHDDPHRFKILCCGRQWGKTKYCSIEGALVALNTPNACGYIVAPFAKRAMKLYRAIIRTIKEFEKAHGRKYIVKDSEKWMYFELSNGTTVWCMSGENLESLPGDRLDFLFIDEAALCMEEVWQVLRPSLLANPKSQAWIVSTPRGKNWFYGLSIMEQSAGQSHRYKTFHFTSYDNPTLPAEEIESLKTELPELLYRQEILAEFISGGLIFRNLDRMMRAPGPQPPIPGHNYVAGVDLAKENDFTVIKIADTSNNTEVYSERSNHRDWSYQKTAIYMAAKRYNNATVIIDKTGVGGSVVEDLQKMDRAYPEAPQQGHLTIVPIAFSTVSKPELFKHYILMHENDLIWLMNDEVTKREHEKFEGELMPSGYIRYGAPKKQNDDTVVAAALMAWGLGKIAGSSLMIGGTEDEIMPHEPKKVIDPAHQIDVEQIIRKMESRQILGFADDEDPNILREYQD